MRPFELETLRLSSFAPLESSESRVLCSLCNRRRMHYCSECSIPLLPLDCLPRVSLPIQVHIIRHIGESPSKSSIIPLRILAPENVSIYTHAPVSNQSLPKFLCSESVLLYPSDDAFEVNDINWGEVKNLIVVDSTWSQTKTVLEAIDPESKIRRVRLSSSYTTRFWRYQTGKPDTCLATVEAIYLLIRDAFEQRTFEIPPLQSADKFPCHSFDDLLWFYVYQHALVKRKSTSGRLPGNFK